MKLIVETTWFLYSLVMKEWSLLNENSVYTFLTMFLIGVLLQIPTLNETLIYTQQSGRV